MTWQQFLTEKVLKECWHEWRYIKGQIKYERWECVKCPAYCIGSAGEYKNRTFDNRNDLMDLYEAVERDGKWEDFFWDFAFQRKPETYFLPFKYLKSLALFFLLSTYC